MKQRKTAVLGLMCAAALALGARQAEAGIVTQSVDIVASTTWTPANEYLLTAPIFVKNGAILTIDAGTVVRGKNLTNASLIISRGSKIRAMGTAANPIVFTTETDNNIGANPGTGVWAQKNNGVGKKWGGVILMGETYITTQTNAPNANILQPIEGIAGYGDIAKYGGGNDDSDSGEMHYCSIRYGGFILGEANEINGLSLGAVGRETEIDHIEVYQNADDGFEFFGGTVNTKYLVAVNTTDDQFDYDEGYRGKGQFMLAVQGLLINADFNEKSDKGTEYDGAINGDTNQPSTVGTYYNWTEVGMGRDSGQTKNTCINLRDGAGARWYNSLWMDFGGALALFEGDYGDPDGDSASKFGENYVAGGLFGAPGLSGAPTSGNGYDHEQTDPNGRQTKKAELGFNVWWKMGTNTAYYGAANSSNLGGKWGTDGSDGNKAFYDGALFSNPALPNFYIDTPAYESPCAQLDREIVGKSIGDGKTYHQVDVLNPLPRPGYDGALMTYGRVPPNDGFFTPVAFIGAFGNSKNWAKDWTLASRLGILTGGTLGDYTGIVPDVTTGATDVLASLNVDNYAGIPADWYLYLENATYGVWKYDPAVPGLPWSFVGPAGTPPTPSLGNAPLSNDFTTPGAVLPLNVLPAGETYTVTLAIDLTVGGGIDKMSTFSKSVTFAQ